MGLICAHVHVDFYATYMCVRLVYAFICCQIDSRQEFGCRGLQFFDKEIHIIPFVIEKRHREISRASGNIPVKGDDARLEALRCNEDGRPSIMTRIPEFSLNLFDRTYTPSSGNTICFDSTAAKQVCGCQMKMSEHMI